MHYPRPNPTGDRRTLTSHSLGRLVPVAVGMAVMPLAVLVALAHPAAVPAIVATALLYRRQAVTGTDRATPGRIPETPRRHRGEALLDVDARSRK